MATLRHKVFLSYHHANDQYYKETFQKIFSDYYNIIIPWSVEIGDIDPNLKTDTIRRKIRDEYLRDSTVTIVLIGSETWKRKHVDWEIYSSLRDTQLNPRSGLVGIILPSYPGFNKNQYNPYTIPPRLWDNIECNYAKIYQWSDDPNEIINVIHEAFQIRNKLLPDLSRPLFINNRNGLQWQ